MVPIPNGDIPSEWPLTQGLETLGEKLAFLHGGLCFFLFPTERSTIVDGPEVYEDRDPAQREVEGPRASMDYSEFTLLEPPKNTRSNCTSVTRTGQRTPPTVCCWDSASPHTLRSCFGSLSLAKAPTTRFSLSLKLARPCTRASRYARPLIPVLSFKVC